jgi:hypothetical protein
MQKLAGRRRKFRPNYLREYGKTRSPLPQFCILPSNFCIPLCWDMFNASELVCGAA